MDAGQRGRKSRLPGGSDGSGLRRPRAGRAEFADVEQSAGLHGSVRRERYGNGFQFHLSGPAQSGHRFAAKQPDRDERRSGELYRQRAQQFGDDGRRGHLRASQDGRGLGQRHVRLEQHRFVGRDGDGFRATREHELVVQFSRSDFGPRQRPDRAGVHGGSHAERRAVDGSGGSGGRLRKRKHLAGVRLYQHAGLESVGRHDGWELAGGGEWTVPLV